MTRPADQSRRELLESLGIGTAGLVLGGYTATARGYAKNETINLGVIGTGGRARGRLMPAAMQIPGVRITAVCDVYDEHLKAGQFVAKGKTSNEVFATVDHHELLNRKDVDAVIIATPDHLHVPLSIDACKAGKDIYVEKPLVHDVHEGQSLIDARNQYQRVIQVGTQQRSMPQFIKGRELIREGKLGDIHLIHMTWARNSGWRRRPVFNIKPEQVDWKRFLGNAPDQPFNPYKMRQWRWFWDFGGGVLTDLMVHWLDAVYFLYGDELGLPATAMTTGDFYSARGEWETPDTIQTILNYPDRGMQLHFMGTFINAYEKAGVTLMGNKATLYVDRGRYELTPERTAPDMQPEQLIIGKEDRGSDFFAEPDGEVLHIANWLEAVRERKQPSSPVEPAVLAATAAWYGNMAWREKRIVEIPTKK